MNQRLHLWDNIDLYCERLMPGISAEPINVVSNLGFIIAGLLLWLLYRKLFAAQKMPDLRRLLILVFAVGIGSALFHTLGTYWAMWADVLPIVAFLLWFLAIYLVRIAKVRWRGLAAGFGAFFAVSAAFSLLVPDELVNGSQTYFSCFVALVFMGVYAWKRGDKGAGGYLAAAAAFLVSLLARSIDLHMCSSLPMGTHFLWHVMNALTMYLACRALFVGIASSKGQRLH